MARTLPRMAYDERASLRAFDGLAATYDRHRPSYPNAIIDALVDDTLAGGVAVDIGCGTGISTLMLAERVATVIGVDPSADMLARAAVRCRDHRGARFMRGTAEATGLDDHAAACILVAQAFHWCDPPRALAEFHRVLCPGGRCALLWNLRVSDGGFTDRYNAIVVGDANALDPSTREGRTRLAEPLIRSPLFRDPRVVSAANPQRLDRDGLIGRATSASYFPRDEPIRSERIRALHEAFDSFAVDGFVTLAQRAELTLATRV
jgi:ubiquinone/menaquinone biosynthesis C-methylase UbiE